MRTDRLTVAVLLMALIGTGFGTLYAAPPGEPPRLKLGPIARVSVHFQWSDWSLKHHSEEEIERLKKVLLRPINQESRLTVVEGAAPIDVTISYWETGWLQGDCERSGIEFRLFYQVRRISGEVTGEKLYQGRVEAPGGKVTKRVRLGDGRTIQEVRCGVAVPFDTLVDRLEEAFRRDPLFLGHR